jgi:ParB family chromosome partitioning protein
MAKLDRSRPRLGRGLSSLLSMPDSEAEEQMSRLPVMVTLPPPPERVQAITVSDTPPTPAADTIRQIAVGLISPNPHQPRRTFDEASLGELAASVKSTGLIQPILVRPHGEGYQMIAGERRWRAAKIAGLASIPAIVREADAATQAQMALVENIQREDLNPLDRAQSYRSLMDQLGLTQAELSTRLGEDRSGIANYLRLLNLVEPVREMVRSAQISFGHAKLLAGVEDMLEQQRLADVIVSGGLSVRQLEVLLKGAPPASATPKAAPSAHIRDLEISLSRQIGMRVQVRTRGKKGGGQLTLHYSSLDQFDELLVKLGAQADPN